MKIKNLIGQFLGKSGSVRKPNLPLLGDEASVDGFSGGAGSVRKPNLPGLGKI